MLRSRNPWFALLALALSAWPATSLADTRPFFLYLVTNPGGGANAIAAYKVDGNANLSPISGSPYATGGNGMVSPVGSEFAHRIAVSRSRRRVFAANEEQGTIAVFDANPSSGALTPVAGSPFKASGFANVGGISLAVSNDGTILYASAGTVLSFRVDDNGALTETGARWSFGVRINGTAVSYQNDRLYLTQSDRLTVLKTGPSGLTSAIPVTFALGNAPTDVAVNEAGNTLWVGSRDGGINSFRVSGDSINPLGIPAFSSTTYLSGLATDAYERTVIGYGSVQPRLGSAVVQTDGSLSGALGSPLAPSIAPVGGTQSPDGSLLVLNSSNSLVDVYRIDASGSLTHLPAYPTSLGLSVGTANMATLATGTPSPTPALPRAMLALLGAGLGLSACLWGARRQLARS